MKNPAATNVTSRTTAMPILTHLFRTAVKNVAQLLSYIRSFVAFIGAETCVSRTSRAGETRKQAQ